LLGLSRGAYYYVPAPLGPEDLKLMKRLDEEYTRHPFYGVRRMRLFLRGQGWPVGRDRVRRLLRTMGLMAVGPKPRTSLRAPGHKIYPYLLRGLAIEGPDHVWAADITYVPMARGFVYLTAVMDWFSRYVLAWRVSLSLDTGFCLEALRAALGRSRPRIFNTDQGSQFTSGEFTGELARAEVAISMDGRGRALDNVFVERLWRSVKYEEVYLKSYDTVWQAEAGLAAWFDFYNHQRPHQGLNDRTPAQVYAEKRNPPSRPPKGGKRQLARHAQKALPTREENEHTQAVREPASYPNQGIGTGGDTPPPGRKTNRRTLLVHPPGVV